MTETARLADYVLPVALAVREVGGELLQPRVPAATRSSCAGRSWTRRPAATCCPSRRSTAGSCTPPASLDDVDLDGLRATAARSREEFGAAAVRPRRRAARAAPAPPGDPLRDARPDAARRRRRGGDAVAQRARARADVRRLGAPRRHRGRGLRARRGAVRADPRLGVRARLHRRRVRRHVRAARVPRQARSGSTIPELLDELEGLRDELDAPADPEFPFVLSAGERRSGTANTIFRDPAWRKQDRDGALRVHPHDAGRHRPRGRRPRAAHDAARQRRGRRRDQRRAAARATSRCRTASASPTPTPTAARSSPASRRTS